MKFPQLVIEQKEYEKQLTDLLDDPDCLLLFDTNILSQMFSLHQAARKEFAAWIESSKSPRNRIMLPAWCLHEYTNKVIRNRLREYIPVGTSIANTTSYSSQLIRHLAMSTDDRAAKGRNHDDRMAFMQALEKAHTDFIKLLPKPDTDEKTVAAVHQDIVAMFGDSVAKSDIFSLLKTCQADYEIRFANHLPPGFLDDHKDKNKLGDYIIWREILEIGRTKAFTSFLYVSNDGKMDWVYAPPKVRLSNQEVVENTVKKTGSVIRLLDPRLEHELSLAAETDVTILLVTFEQLVRILVRRDEIGFKQLAEAVQLSKPRPSKEVAAGAEEGSPATTATEPLPILSPVQATPPLPALPTAPITPDSFEGKYPNWVLADADYQTQETPLGELIDQLQVYTWDVQNAAVNALTVPLVNAASADELFVLGRNLLQAAAGSSFAALKLLTDFPGRLGHATPASLLDIFNGVLYEVYFDCDNHFRYSHGKAGLLYELCAALEQHPFLKPCASFIAHHLVEYEYYVLFLPLLKQTRRTITLAFRTNKNSLQQVAVLESCFIDDDPEPISVNIPPGMGTPAEEEIHYLHHYTHDIERLSAAIALSRYIPVEYTSTALLLDDNAVEWIDEYRIPGDLAV